MARFASSTALAKPHRAAPNPWKGRAMALQTRLQHVGKKAKAAVGQQEEAAISVGTALLAGVMQSRGTILPTFMNLDPNLVWGAGLALLGPRVMKGKNGARLEAAGVGLLSVAAHSAAVRGTVKIGEDDDED